MRRALTALIFMAFSAPTLAQATHPIVGVWITDQQAEITVAPCAAGYCGYLSKIVIPEARLVKFRQKGRGYRHSQPDGCQQQGPESAATAASRPRNAQPQRALSANAFEGEIYNPEDGNTYYGKLELVDQQQVKLTGCALVVLCQSQAWFRAPKINPPPFPAKLIPRP